MERDERAYLTDVVQATRQSTTQLERVNSLQEKVRQESIHDSLTSLFNRRFLDEALPIELARSRRANSPLTILMLDIDHFKNINDTYGHQVGDAVLQYNCSCGQGCTLKVYRAFCQKLCDNNCSILPAPPCR